MMPPRRKRRSNAPRQVAAIIERLDPRVILDAPLALSSDGLLLADPTPDELLEPALFVGAMGRQAPAAFASPSSSAAWRPLADAPVRMAQTPSSPAPVASRTSTELSLSTTLSSGTSSVWVISLGGVTEDISGPRTSYFRFEATGCGVPPPSSMTVSFTVDGTATMH